MPKSQKQLIINDLYNHYRTLLENLYLHHHGYDAKDCYLIIHEGSLLIFYHPEYLNNCDILYHFTKSQMRIGLSSRSWNKLFDLIYEKVVAGDLK